MAARMIQCGISEKWTDSRQSMGGAKVRRTARASLITASWVKRLARRAAKYACSRKQVRIHQPVYWNTAGMRLEKALRTIARSGTESEKMIELENSRP